MEQISEKGVYQVVWPRGRRVVGEGLTCARRLNSLEGKTICELWDGVFQGDRVFSIIEKELKKQIPGIGFVGYQAFGMTHSEAEAEVLAALPEKLKRNKCDAVISSMGC